MVILDEAMTELCIMVCTLILIFAYSTNKDEFVAKTWLFKCIFKCFSMKTHFKTIVNKNWKPLTSKKRCSFKAARLHFRFKVVGLYSVCQRLWTFKPSYFLWSILIIFEVSNIFFVASWKFTKIVLSP